MLEDDLKIIIKERASLNEEDDFQIEKFRNKLIEILSKSECETISFLNLCDRETVLWVSEVFEEVSYNLQSIEYIQCLKRLDKKYPELNLTDIVEIAESYMENKIISKFELHKKWVETIGKEGEKLCLDEVNLTSFDLSDKLLEQAHLADCIFDNLKLENIDFHASVLCSSSYKNTSLYACNFYKTDLAYTDFTGAVIKGVNFSKSDFWEAKFRNTDLSECKLINGSFYLTDFSNAKLNNVDISGAVFEKTLLNGVILKNIIGIGEAHFKSINIGTSEEPILLEAEQAKEWIVANCS